MSRCSLLTAALMVVGASLSLSGALAQEGPAQVRVDAVRVEPLSQTVPILGRLVANQRGEVAARVAGAVQRLEVQVGDRLDEGDVIVVLDEARLEASAALGRARVSAAEAEIETQTAQLSLLQGEAERLARLRNSAAFSRAALDDKTREIQGAQAVIARAQAQLEEALADLALAERDLVDARIKAPYSSVVTDRFVSAGDYLQIGDPVVALMDELSLEIEADVPSIQARALELGAVLDVNFEGAGDGQATLRAVVPDENPLTRTLAVRLELDEAAHERLLASGQSVTIDVPVGAADDVTTVHKDAVLRRGPTASVFVANEGQAMPRNVRLGAAVGERFVVEDGLAPGELVVVRGNERLRPQQPIAYETPAESDRPVLTGSAS